MNEDQRPEAKKPTEPRILHGGDLRSRAEAYLRGPRLISEPGASLTRLVRRYIAGEPWDSPEVRELLLRYIQTAEIEADRRSGAPIGPENDARIFYKRAAAILQDIQAAVSARGP